MKSINSDFACGTLRKIRVEEVNMEAERKAAEIRILAERKAIEGWP